MLPSQLLSLRLVAAAGLALAADPAQELRVLRVVPAEVASPGTVITVTFDRPVAGSLDRTVDPRGLFRIEPSVAGTVDWRDPVTIRFRPTAPLPADREFTITISDRFQAMDGSRLAGPFVHSFRVRGARVLAGSPVGPSDVARHLTPETRFDLVVDVPVDTAAVARSVYLEFNRLCRAPGIVRLRVEDQRPITRTTAGNSERRVGGTATAPPIRFGG
jgi:hypothetical protein